MLIVHMIVAAIAVAVLALRPQSNRAGLLVGAAGAADLLLGAPVGPALRVLAPLVAFVCAALTLASEIERTGLAGRAAGALAAAARGNSTVLYVLVCALCALVTAAVSLDGAVVLMVPVLVALAKRFGAPLAPLFLGTVVVANAASLAVPQGNPTNLVLVNRLGLSAPAFLAHMLLPGLAAALVCATGVAVYERRTLRATAVGAPTHRPTPLSPAERHAAASLVLAAVVAWVAPIVGVAPWWPFTGAVALAVATGRRRPELRLPWRLALQVGGLLIATQALRLTVHVSDVTSLPAMLGVAAAVGAASALANNLPISACATGLLAAGGPAYAASVGLAVGALATPQGSVATLIATQLAGAGAPTVKARLLAPLAVAGSLIAVVLLWASL